MLIVGRMWVHTQGLISYTASDQEFVLHVHVTLVVGIIIHRHWCLYIRVHHKALHEYALYANCSPIPIITPHICMYGGEESIINV